jgi:hypothetical protein
MKYLFTYTLMEPRFTNHAMKYRFTHTLMEPRFTNHAMKCHLDGTSTFAIMQ